MTGWGQDGPLAREPGHDINYISLAGVLAHIGTAGGPPVPPINLIGDFGGGGLLLAFGVLAALLERERSGRGQVIDAAMVDGASTLMGFFHGMLALGAWGGERGTNILDTGAPFYEVYETADGKHVAIGSIERQFYTELLTRSGLAKEELPHQLDRDQWPAMKARFAAVFKQKTRDEWCHLMEGSDVCFAPVLDMGEAPQHPHNRHRGTFIDVAGQTQPGPAPRFSRTPGEVTRPAAHPGQHTDEALAAWGVAASEIARLRASGAIS
jgi:alpha-methylacyl-CoA racemase